jgi:parallel beta-helix repeat protein
MSRFSSRFALFMGLMLFLGGTMSGVFEVRRVEESGTIYIRADGSIDPPDAPISTVDNVTYTLTGNITSDADGIVVERDSIMVYGQGYTVQGTGSGTGITLSGRSNVTIQNTEITAFSIGIWLNSSSNDTISGNDVTANSWGGIKLENCLDINIVNNDITDNDLAGIWLFFSNSSLVSQNRITRTPAGIILDMSSSNTILENDVRDNRENMVFEYSVNGGVALSSHNRIFHNNFINGTWNAVTHFAGQPENFWDDGYPSGGNYWSDYNGTDVNHDGIGDTSYVIDTKNADNYPLMGTFYEFTVPDGMLYNIATVSNFTILDLYSLHELRIDGPWYLVLEFTAVIPKGTVGFCRIDIPRVLIDGPYHVFTLGGNFTPTELPISNSSHAFLYFTFNHSGPVIIVPEFPSFLILPLFFIATLLAVTFYKRRQTKTT